MQSIADRIHSQAVEISIRYKKAEAELIDILQQAEDHRVFLVHKYASLYAYVTDGLRISENTAYSLITVARKARQLPRLKIEIQKGTITFSNARRVASVLTLENQEEWLEKARQLSSRELEKEIVKVRPQEATRERVSYVTEHRLKLEIGLSESEFFKLQRAQDLLCQKYSKALSLEETVGALTSEYLHQNDPVIKAERVKKPSETVDKLVTQRESSERKPIPAAVLHRVNLRDLRKCTFVLNGQRCNQTRWTEVHHIIPVSHGGPDTVENLTTLCPSHHKLQHRV
jgi:5-methylcytosine-specific restriction endonuclease McrA